MESARDYVKAFRQPGDSSRRSMKKGSPDTVQPGTTPPDSSSSTLKQSLRSSLQELQLMLGPQTLEFCKGLEELNQATETQDLEKLMVAVRKVRDASRKIDEACGTIEMSLFELKDPTWTKVKNKKQKR